MRQLLTSLFLSITVLSPAIAQDLPPDLDAFVAESMKSRNVPGLALGVIKDGKVVHSKGYGVRTLGKPGTVDEQTIFCIGSMTKAFTAAACAKLVSERRLRWDQPVRSLLPGFSLQGVGATQATVGDLLSMRTGLPATSTLVAFAEIDSNPVRMVSLMTPAYGFRDGWQYSNESYILAGKCVERAAGVSWHRFVKERLFVPLGMGSTTTRIDDIHSSNVASPHAEQHGKLQPVKPFRLVNGAPAGAINSNLVDCLKWIKYHLDSSKNAQLQECHKPQNLLRLDVPTDTAREFDAYGYGWFVQDVEGTKVVSHGGNILGMSSMGVFVPKKQLGIVVLCNKEGTDERDVLCKKILMHFLDPEHEASVLAQAPRETSVAPTAGSGTEARITNYNGTYTNSAFGTMQLTTNAITYGKLRGTLRRKSDGGNSFDVDWNLPISDGRELTITRLRDNSLLLLIDDLRFRRVTPRRR
jgi:CubicO group peptidase (beta-lactamase class C family)